MIPFITSLSPTGGTTAGGNHVTITGGNFTGTTGAAGVKFGGFNAASYTVTNDTHIDAVPAAHTAVTVNLHVNNGNGSNPLGPQTQYTFTASGAPTVTSISPTNGATAGGTIVTITGTNMSSATAALFGAISVVPSASTGTTVTATSPAQAAGQYDITVTTASGTSTPVLGDLFTYSDFTESYTSGTTDAGGNVMSGTETRNMDWHTIPNGDALPDGNGNLVNCTTPAGCPVLFMSNGFWEDSACLPPNPNTSQGPQIVALTSTLGSWALDKELPGTCGQDASGNSLFDVASSSHDFTINYDGNGNALSPAPDILVVAGTGIVFYARHDSVGSGSTLWDSTSLTGATNSIRSMGNHEDDSSGAPNNHVDYLLLGNSDKGIYHATFKTSPWGFTSLNTPENYCLAVSGTSCTNPCSPNTNNNCTNENGDWPFGLSVLSVTSAGGQVTLTWGAGSALRAPLSPGYSQISISGVTCSGGTAPTGLKTVNAATSTSATVTASGTGCSGGTVTTPTNSPCGTVIGCPNEHRIVGITECPVSSGGNTAGKAAFMANGMQIWQRIDKGSASIWFLKGDIPYPSAGYPTGQPQLRGLSCVQSADSSNYPNGWELLGHIEGDGKMWAMNPDTGIFRSEANLVTVLNTAWGFGGYGIDAYNSAGINSITVSATNYYIFGEGDASGAGSVNYVWSGGSAAKWAAASGVWIRTTGATPSYSVCPATTALFSTFLGQINPTTNTPPAYSSTASAPLPVMISTRAGPLVSQFTADAGTVLFMGGTDMNKTPMHNTAWVGRLPVTMCTWP